VEDNVECVFGEIGRVTEKGIIDAIGKEREYDAISERAKVYSYCCTLLKLLSQFAQLFVNTISGRYQQKKEANFLTGLRCFFWRAISIYWKKR
jgi:hypothetical protein